MKFIHLSSSEQIRVLKPYISALVLVFIGIVLLWEHLNGGIAAHHLLHQKELPAISNAWSALLLPVLSWIFLYRIELRLKNRRKPEESLKSVILIFIAGLLIGALLALSFTYNYEPFLNNVLIVILVLAFFIPIFYAEFMLGFILAMTITFGAILPTMFILIFSAIGFIIYKYVRSNFMRLWHAVTNKSKNA